MSKISDLLTTTTTTTTTAKAKTKILMYCPPLSDEPNCVGKALDRIEKIEESSKEMVNHPQHYQSKNGMEAIDVIEAFDLGFNLGNVIKYILRAGKKDATVQELEKAKWYLEREINKMKEN